MRKRRVVGRIYEMKYSWKGHKDRNRHKNRVKKEWASLLGLYHRHKLTKSPTPFYSVLVFVSVFMALSTLFHSINSPNISSLSHSVLLVLFLPYWSFQLYISLWKSPQPWCNPLWLTGLKAPTNSLSTDLFQILDVSRLHNRLLVLHTVKKSVLCKQTIGYYILLRKVCYYENN